MKVIWIILFVVLFILNLFHLAFDCVLPFVTEHKKKKSEGPSHDRCSCLNTNNECEFVLIRLWRKARKNKTAVCPGAEKCIFFVSEDIDTGKVKRANLFFLIINSLVLHIPALTALIITFYEIVNMF